jgi:hypothetical protein
MIRAQNDPGKPLLGSRMTKPLFALGKRLLESRSAFKNWALSAMPTGVGKRRVNQDLQETGRR